MTRETATINAQGQIQTTTQDLTLEVRKRKLLTELYKTGCLDGDSFGRDRLKNPIKTYIAGCMYRQHITNSPELVEDCYNETFTHLQAMDAAKVCDLYDTAPAKLFATALRIVSLKCFAIDPRYNNPRHSLIQSVMFASSVGIGGHSIEHCDNQNIVLLEQYSNYNLLHDEKKTHMNVLQARDTVEDFELVYGMPIEQILESLTEDEVTTFYEMAGTQPRGKTSGVKKAKREALVERLKQILGAANVRTTVATIRKERKFKGSIYESN